MDGERLVSMGDRPQNVRRDRRHGEIDDLYEAFNDQDLDRLTEEFEGMTYRSPSGVEFEGAEAAEHWADAFGLAVTRTTGVFAIGDGGSGSSPSTGNRTQVSPPHTPSRSRGLAVTSPA
jgi:hypothetical protein